MRIWMILDSGGYETGWRVQAANYYAALVEAWLMFRVDADLDVVLEKA